MRTPAFYLLLLLVPVLGGAAAASPILAMQAGAQADTLASERGWSLDSLRVEGAEVPGVRRVRATGRIRLPAAIVWRVLAGKEIPESDCWPGLKECRVESIYGDTTVARYIVAVPMYKDRRYRLRNVTDEEHRRIRFAQVPGYGNIRSIEGHWRVTALGDSLSKVDYGSDIDPGVRWVPSFIVTWATKSAVPSLYSYLYERGIRLRGAGR